MNPKGFVAYLLISMLRFGVWTGIRPLTKFSAVLFYKTFGHDNFVEIAALLHVDWMDVGKINESGIGNGPWKIAIVGRLSSSNDPDGWVKRRNGPLQLVAERKHYQDWEMPLPHNPRMPRSGPGNICQLPVPHGARMP